MWRWKNKNRLWSSILFFVMVSVSMLSALQIYAAEKNDVIVSIPVKIVITGKTQQKETFSFLLQQKDTNTPMPDSSIIQLSKTKEEAFRIRYTEPGVYQYCLKQITGKENNWKYDQTEYSLEVYVVRNEKTERLQAYTVFYNEKGEKAAPVFRNVYQVPEIKQKSVTVKTGDAADVNIWMILLVVCIGVFTGVCKYRNKVTEKN